MPRKKEGELFFLLRKNQRTSSINVLPSHPSVFIDNSLFASFSSKKEDIPFLILPTDKTPLSLKPRGRP